MIAPSSNSKNQLGRTDCQSVLRFSRRGITLLEVLVSLSIFLMSLAVIAQLISHGAARAVDVQLESQGAQLAQSKLAEVVTGAQALDGSDGTFGDEAPGWSWSIQSSQADLTGLWNVTVTVSKERANGTPFEVALNQFVLDPSYRGSSFDTPPAASSTDTSSTNSSSSSTPSGTSSSIGGVAGSSGGAAAKSGATKPTTSTSGTGTKPTTGGGTTTGGSKSSTGSGTTPSGGGTTTPRSGAGTGTTPSSGGGSTTPRSGSGTRGP